MAGGQSTARIEAVIGHAFADRDLLVRALTHRSGGADHYERLEFLGDAVLGYLVAKRLFEQHPRASEHELTLMRASLIRKETLSEIAVRYRVSVERLRAANRIDGSIIRAGDVLRIPARSDG